MDSFKPRTCVPSLQLKAKVLRREEVQDLSYVLNQIGAREPKNKLLVEVEPVERSNTYGGMYLLKLFLLSPCIHLTANSLPADRALVPSQGKEKHYNSNCVRHSMAIMIIIMQYSVLN